MEPSGTGLFFGKFAVTDSVSLLVVRLFRLYLVIWGSPWNIWGSECINHLFPSEWSWGVGYLFLNMLSQEQCLWWEVFWTSLLTWWVWFYILWDAGNCQLVSNFSQREVVYKLLLYCCVCRGKEDFICHLADFTLLGRTIFLTTLNFAHYKILMEKVVLVGGALIFRILIINDLKLF